MYFAVMKIDFVVESLEHPSRKDLASLVEKIRAKHRVAVMIAKTLEEHGQPCIAVTGLALSEEALSRQLDSIVSICEESGVGRVEREETLMDHLDSFGGEDDD